jgi:hypothetical protein
VAAKLYKAYGKSCNPKADFIPDLSTAPVHFPQTRAMTAIFLIPPSKCKKRVIKHIILFASIPYLLYFCNVLERE